MLKFIRNDDDFNLRNIEYKEIFSALRKDIVSAIKLYKDYESIDSKDIKLNNICSHRMDSFFDDGNLYPIITLDIEINSLYLNGFNLIIDPFNIKLIPQKYEAKVFNDKNLTNSFIKFMLMKFPEANYLEKRNQFFERVSLQHKVRENLLYSK